MIQYCEESDLKNYTLIFPAVSVGNAAQLTADLLIYNLNLKKLGFVYHESVLPVVSADPFGDSPEISTACELFFSKSLKLIVLQNRSAFVAKSQLEFLSNLCDWIQKEGISKVVILTGSEAHVRKDKQLLGEAQRYVLCPLQEDKKSEAIKENLVELERYSDHLSIPGSGVTVKLFNLCVEKAIKCCILLTFCSEGNNVPDSEALVSYVASWLKLEPVKWQHPPSWILMFGSQAPKQLFN